MILGHQVVCVSYVVHLGQRTCVYISWVPHTQIAEMVNVESGNLYKIPSQVWGGGMLGEVHYLKLMVDGDVPIGDYVFVREGEGKIVSEYILITKSRDLPEFFRIITGGTNAIT